MSAQKLQRAVRTAMTVFAALVASATACAAASFTAEFISATRKDISTGRVYVKDNKIRREVNRNGQELITIIRGDKQVTWVIRPDKKEYTESKRAVIFSPDPVELKKFADPEEAGEETIAGFTCKKTIYRSREEQWITVIVWMCEQLNWPLKVQINNPGGGTMTEYKNVEIKKLDDSLFELPHGYKNVTVPPQSAKPAAGK